MGWPIHAVAGMVGVPRNTLLAWERRYGLVRPDRRENGYREYTSSDVALLRSMKELVDRGLRPAEAADALRARRAPVDDDDEVAPLMEALLRYDRAAADASWRALPPRSHALAVEELLMPLLRRVGDAWARGDASVAQEHFASGWVRQRLIEMLVHLDHGPQHGPLDLLACAPGERHELGLLGVAVRLAAAGRRVAWLGADVPLADLLAAARELRPRRVLVAVVMPVPAGVVGAWAREIAACLPEDGEVVFGGAGLPDDPPRVGRARWVGERYEDSELSGMGALR